MKNSTKFKLSGYSAAAISLIAAHDLNGQIIYQDLEPDHLWIEPEITASDQFDSLYQYGLDIDSDGDNNFYFRFIVNVNYDSSIGTSKGAWLHVGGDNKNLVAYSDLPDYPFSNNDGVKMLNYGDPVGSSQLWNNEGKFFDADLSEFGPSYFCPWWPETPIENKYMGVKFKLDGSFHYGWVRLTIRKTIFEGVFRMSEIRIKDFAYNAIANETIIAGDMGDCYHPSVDGTSAISLNSAILNWAPVSNASTYQIRYKKSGSPWTNVSIAAPGLSTILSGLTCNTDYQWKIRSKCDGVFTSFSNLQFFTTESCRLPVDNNTITSINIFPNPASETIFIDLNNFLDEKINIRIYNMLGEEIFSEYFISDDLIQINISGFAKGNYILKVLSENKSAAENFIIE